METDFLVQLSHGDNAAFKYVFDTYYKSICLFIRKYVVDTEQAEDIAQEVFLRLYEKKGRFASEDALKAYMYRTAKNMSINCIKHEAVKKRYRESANTDPACDQLFLNQYIEQEVSRLLMQAIDQLPTRQKAILGLSLDGMKNQEIAKDLDLSVHTVKSHKAVAYKYIKTHLKDILSLVAVIISC